MKFNLVTACALLALGVTPVAAQTNTAVGVGVGTGISSSRSLSRANSSSQSSVRSANLNANQSGAQINTVTNVQGNAPSVFAPGMSAAGIESCNGSISLGGSAVGGGGALGFPWQDGPCNKRLNARTLWAFGQREAAIQTLCLDDEIALSLTASGIRCRVGRYAPQVVAHPVVPVAVPVAVEVEPTYYDRRGRHFHRVACRAPGARPSADPGVCVRLASN